MKRLKKFFAVFALTGMLMAPAPAVLAQGNDVLQGPCSENPGATACRSNTNQTQGNNSFFGPNGIIVKAARLVTVIVGIAAVAMIIIGGIRYALSAGDPSSAKGARDSIMYAVIGLVVAATAQGIIVFVLGRL